MFSTLPRREYTPPLQRGKASKFEVLYAEIALMMLKALLATLVVYQGEVIGKGGLTPLIRSEALSEAHSGFFLANSSLIVTQA